MGIRLSEHEVFIIKKENAEFNTSLSNKGLVLSENEFSLYETVSTKPFNHNSFRYLFEKNTNEYILKADYCVGIDWLGKTGRYVYVEPKINSKSIQEFETELQEDTINKFDENIKNQSIYYELDYLKMLLQVTSINESNNEVSQLIQIDWNANPIQIEQKDDLLTPFLIIRFLQALKTIVRKGLKKNYYKVKENLTNKIKGKILVTQQTKQNVLKNRLTSTYCEFQVFGEDHLENRFLKRVFQFVISYVENNKEILAQNLQTITETINFCKPSFELISNDINLKEIKHLKYNPFYKEYRDAIEAGNYILKKFGYAISKTGIKTVSTPPFWIDMPSLFELYVYSKIIEHNPMYKKHIHYQFSTYGNALDILVAEPQFQMVIDTKYKLSYNYGHLHHDIRQVAGYARLNKVRNQLNIFDDQTINCLIIYPDMENGIHDFSLENIQQSKQPIKDYYKVYKLGVKLPLIK